MNINAIESTITREDAASILQAKTSSIIPRVQKLIYYPYYWVFFSFRVKTLFGMGRNNKASCLVDMINNQAATSDIFKHVEVEVPEENILENDFSEEESLKTARTYLNHAAMHKMKALVVPQSEIIEEKKIHKPFWVVKCFNQDNSHFTMIVDAVTGKYQNL